MFNNSVSKEQIMSTMYICLHTCRIQVDYRSQGHNLLPTITYLDLPSPPGDGGQISTVGGPSALFCSATNSFSSSACCFCRETTLSGSWMLSDCRQEQQRCQNMLRDALGNVYIQTTGIADYDSGIWLHPAKLALVLLFFQSVLIFIQSIVASNRVQRSEWPECSSLAPAPAWQQPKWQCGTLQPPN